MFEFDPDIINRLSNSQRRRILLEGREIFVIFAAIIFSLGLMIILGGEGVWGMWFVILSLILFIASLSRVLFMSAAKQDRFITSSLVEKSIRRAERKTGNVFSESERDKIRFKYDPIFHDQITARSCKHLEAKHRQRIARLKQALQQLESERAAEIERLQKLRWQNMGTRDLYYSLRDGQIRINQSTLRNFSDLKRITVTLENNERHVKRVSASAVKQRCYVAKDNAKSKIDQEVNKRLQSKSTGVEEILPEHAADKPVEKLPLLIERSIPTCSQIAVKIEFEDETSTGIMLLPGRADWSSKKCQSAYHLARRIERELQLLSTTPQPKTIQPIEEEPLIRSYDRKIKRTKKHLRSTESKPPQPTIPERYLYLEPTTSSVCAKNQKDLI